MEMVKRSVVARDWGMREAMNKQSIEDFKNSENTVCDTIMMDTRHSMFVQACTMYNTKSEP